MSVGIIGMFAGINTCIVTIIIVNDVLLEQPIVLLSLLRDPFVTFVTRIHWLVFQGF